MSILDALIELLPVILSSAGITGGLFAATTAIILKKAKKDAETKRVERLRLEILRLEGEEKMSALLFAILRQTRGMGDEHELLTAEKAYTEHLDNCSKLKNEIISNHFG